MEIEIENENKNEKGEFIKVTDATPEEEEKAIAEVKKTIACQRWAAEHPNHIKRNPKKRRYEFYHIEEIPEEVLALYKERNEEQEEEDMLVAMGINPYDYYL